MNLQEFLEAIDRQRHGIPSLVGQSEVVVVTDDGTPHRVHGVEWDSEAGELMVVCESDEED